MNGLLTSPRAWLALLALAACGAQQTLKAKDVTVHFAASPLSLTIDNADGARVLALDSGGLLATLDRPNFVGQIIPGWDDYRANEQPFSSATHGRMVKATSHTAQATFDIIQGTHSATATLDVSVSEARVNLTWTVASGFFNKTSMRFVSNVNEHFFGLGERFTSVDHRGLALYSWAEEGGIGLGENVASNGTAPLPNGPSMTYFPVPFFHSTANYSLLANTTWRTEMHLADESADRFRVAANDTVLPIVIYVRKTPLARLNDYTADTGRPMIPAPWVWGVRSRSATDDVDGVPAYQLMRQLQLPCTVIADEVHFLPADSQTGREDQLAASTQSYHDWGYKVTAYNTPYVSSSDPIAAADFAYGKNNGLFQLGADELPASTNFISGAFETLSPIDLSNPLGAAWYQKLLSRTIATGYEGWMNDFGEYTARSSVMFDGRRGEEIHNLYPVLSAKAAHDVLETKLPNDYWFYVRSGYIGTQQYVPEVWGGDAEASFDDSQGLPAVVRGGINLGLVGVSQFGSDVTGFKCVTDDPKDKEIFIRWLQFGAVSPMFHEENACANPLGHRSKWKLWNDSETQQAWRTAASLHTRLAPYLRAQAVVANATGMPIMRHPFLLFPTASDAWAVQDSYFFGPSFYAAPVVRRGQTSRAVWFPPGRYVDWNDQTIYVGPGTFTVPAPLMQLPLFLVENSVVPMLDSAVQTLVSAKAMPDIVAEADRADVLDVVAALGPSGSATATLVDGTVIVLTRLSAPGAEAGTQATEADLSTCATCYVPSAALGEISRARFNSALAASFTIVHEDIQATVTGTLARRLRFEVWRLPD